VRVIAPEVGGGFGSKSYYPVAMEAARLAKVAGRPVRVAYTRTEEMVWSTFRPAALIQVRSGFNADGKIVAWEFKAHHAGPRAQVGRRGSETPYDIPNVSVTVAASASPLRSGSYRSLGGSVNHFARESHIDEIAAILGMDPVELRLRNLSNPRFRRVLTTAAERFGWTRGAAPSCQGMPSRRVRNDATTIRARLCIHPSRRSCRIPASTSGRPVMPSCQSFSACPVSSIGSSSAGPGRRSCHARRGSSAKSWR